MREFAIEDKLQKKLAKLYKKQRKLFYSIMKKIVEIVNSADVGSYKNLKAPMQRFKRVHFGSFVLIFKYDKSNDRLTFVEFEHHDKAYRK